MTLSGEERLLQICAVALDSSQADQTQVTVTSVQSSLTRYANSIIHQSVSEQDYEVAVKVAVGKRIGYASANKLSEESVRATVGTATRFARSMPEDPDFDHLPYRSELYSRPATYCESTAAFGPEDRAQAVRQIVDVSREAADALASGSVKITTSESAVANSFGVRAYSPSTSASLVVLTHTDDGTGWSEEHSREVSQISWADNAREASAVCKRNRNQQDIEAGDYTVVLMPDAVIDLVSMLGWMGFDAKSYQEERSFLRGRIGERLMSESISIYDDGADERGFARSFDGEGVPKQKVDLITNGVAMGVVYDSYTAGKDHRETTGHGTSRPQFQPYPLNLILAPGDATLEDMIASTSCGILVSRFHYTNDIQPSETLATGMTRDGTFLIEGGKLSHPVKNLRFTDKIIRAFSTVEAIGKDLKCSPGVAAPALKLGSFLFTSTTEF